MKKYVERSTTVRKGNCVNLLLTKRWKKLLYYAYLCIYILNTEILVTVFQNGCSKVEKILEDEKSPSFTSEFFYEYQHRYFFFFLFLMLERILILVSFVKNAFSSVLDSQVFLKTETFESYFPQRSWLIISV